ncbi:MAG: tryptophan--tRNA ligase [Bacteroidota bacterium]|nr:tryptophan--tRNA ligase [Bacteroidota bacterium]
MVSGIKPSGDLTIGNYLGAMKRWAENQEGCENFFFIANLHAITVKQDPELLKKRTFDIVAWLLTVGVDPNSSVIFIQSMVPAHSEICWILNNYVTMGELGKMTQFKDKSSKAGREGQLVGLYDYPVLMAGDVLLYDADEIPVGIDQTQHIELCKAIALRFNNQHGETFKIPKATVSKTTAKIMSLNDPTKKMSKSESGDSYIALDERHESILKKFKRAVTDSDNKIKFSKDKPAIGNLLVIYSEFADKLIEEIEKDYQDKGYGQFKSDLGEIVSKKIGKLQAHFSEFRADEERLNNIILEGNKNANIIANEKLSVVKEKLGLV